MNYHKHNFDGFTVYCPERKFVSELDRGQTLLEKLDEQSEEIWNSIINH